jgi:hypothetical protein
MTHADKTHGGYLQKVSERSKEYLAEILKENERLRMQVASKEHEIQDRAQAIEKAVATEKENRNLTEMVELLEDQLRSLKKQNIDAFGELAASQASLARLEKQIAQAETENRRFFEKYSFIEKENGDLMNLYVTSYRIHGTLDRREVLEAIKETIINLVGSEDFAVYELDAERRSLILASSFGIDEEAYRSVPFGQGTLGEAAARGETFFASPEGGPDGLPEGKRLLALVPMKLGNQVSGAIALFSLLPQKNGVIEGVDLELFDLLATHAATALYLTRLHGQFGGNP